MNVCQSYINGTGKISALKKIIIMAYFIINYIHNFDFV